MSIDALKSELDKEEAKFRALLRQRDGLDRQIEASRNRLDAFQQALALVTGQAVPAETFLEDGAVVMPNGQRRPVIGHVDPWEDALRVMEKKGGEFTTDQIIAEARSRGSDIPRIRARSRLAHAVDRHRLRRVREGVFEFPKGETGT
jgi:hypothetical protein